MLEERDVKPLSFFSPARNIVFLSTEYTITMYDTKSKELRWNATYFNYAATLPEEDAQYSKNINPSVLAGCGNKTACFA